MKLFFGIVGILLLGEVVFLFFMTRASNTISTEFSLGSQKNTVAVVLGDTVVHAEVAATSEEKQKGLSGREYLSDGEGMIFLFDRPGYYHFWMKGTHIPLDFIWILKNTIVDITENVSPPLSGTPDVDLATYSSRVASDSVLEVPAGFIKKHRVHISDAVIFER